MSADPFSKTAIDNLCKELKDLVDGEVEFNEKYRALYSTDSSNYRQVPIGVVFPKNKSDIKNAIALCNKYQVPVLCRGGGTSLAGQCCNVAVILDFSRYYNNILSFDEFQSTVIVEPGIVLDDLRKNVESYGLTFGPDPATHNHCTIGGMIGNNSCGVHSVMAAFEGEGARTGDFVEELEVLLYDGTVMTVGRTDQSKLKDLMSRNGKEGEVYRKLKSLSDKYSNLIREKFPDIPRRVSGYNLDELLPENKFNVARSLAGSESTCVIILAAKLKLIHYFKFRVLLVIGYDDVFDAAKHIEEILKFKPLGLEGVDDKLVDFMRRKNLHTDLLQLLPEGNGWLWVEFGGDTYEEALKNADRLKDFLSNTSENDINRIRIFKTKEEQERIWRVRDSGLGATAFVPDWPDTWEGWEDAAVPPEKLSGYLRDFRSLLKKYNYDSTTYGHFGQGCVHCRINFDFTTEEGISKYKNFTSEAADLVISYGGSLSGEHGDGQSRGELLIKMYGEEIINAFREFKNIWDPNNKMNPGKVVDAYPRDSNLRLGAGFSFKPVQTMFEYPSDKNNFGRAVMRCVGVGECRKTDHGVMCPSYLATRDEQHSTRGRAHLLFEMMTRNLVNDVWKNKSVKEALDLCLACKGCLGECPVHVDMATYKAEYFSHYYTGRIRPMNAYLFGKIDKVLSIGKLFPGIFNFILRDSIFSSLFKTIGRIEPTRILPKLSSENYSSWHRKISNIKHSDKKVLLWPDTFNNFYFPQTLKSAYSVLTNGGFEVLIPKKHLCCGRPLYDFGMLNSAKKYLEMTISGLKEFLDADISFVGLEPSCVSVFRNELVNLFPKNESAIKLSKSFFTLAEFISANKNQFNFRHTNMEIVYHGHCHQKAILNDQLEQKLLLENGFKLNIPESGCCGLAGSFGFEKGEKYKVSMLLGERKLFPSIRTLPEDETIIADGFSCREQILHGTGRRAVHLAEILHKII